MLAEVRKTLRSKGLAVHPIKTRAKYLSGYGFAPSVIFDVGVYRGTPWLYRSFPDTKFVLIDPQAEHEAEIRASGRLAAFDFLPVALGAEPGEATLHLPSNAKGEAGAMASLMERTDKLSEKFTALEARQVVVQRLDDLSEAYPGAAGLKIDTEGFETEVLQGASETLKRCQFVILELSLDAGRFSQTKPPSSAILPLAEAGLELRDILATADGPSRRSRPRHVDALFTRWDA